MVLWEGSPLTTTQFVRSTRVEAWVPAELLNHAGQRPVSVQNPEPGGGTADPLTFSRWWRMWLPWAMR